MKISQAGLLLIAFVALLAASACGVVNQVRARNELNDGAKAYKERKFDEAGSHFERALELNKDQKFVELALARTLHQQYLAKRSDPANVEKAKKAIQYYKAALADNPNDDDTNRAVASLIESIDGQDAQIAYLTQRANDPKVNGIYRADAFTTLGSKEYVCANTITEAAKETVQTGAQNAELAFKKPADAAEFEKAKGCTQRGTELVNRALELNPEDSCTKFGSSDLSNPSDKELKEAEKVCSVAQSAVSYRTSLIVQQARLAEMDGNKAEKDRLLAESKALSPRFQELGNIKLKLEEEAVRRKGALEEEK